VTQTTLCWPGTYCVTRGKQLVVLVGQKRAVAIAVRGGQMKRRWTKLREWLS
jgi:exodeoxyribonuclease V alpha subunit